MMKYAGKLAAILTDYVYRGRLQTTVQNVGLEDRLLVHYKRFLHATTGEYFPEYPEQTVIQDMIKEVSDDDVFYDIGAEHGFYSFWLSELTSLPQAVLFEPEPSRVKKARQRMASTTLDAEIHQYALGSSSGTVQLDLNDDIKGAPSIGTASNNSVEVKLKRGDDIIAEQKLPRPTIVKIDVEGAEFNVLQGLHETLDAGAPRVIYCEVHLPEEEWAPSVYDFGSSPEDVHQILEDHGYSVSRIQERRRDYHIKAERQSS
jgi:FkbM family methyltransferase